MLFESAGQGFIFLLLLCLGLFCGLLDCLAKGVIQSILQKFVKKDKNVQNTTKKDNNLQKSKNITITSKIIQNSTRKDKKGRKKSTKNNIKIQNITKKMLAGVGGFCEVCLFAVLLILVVFWVDYGDFRFYHILAFLVGFCLIKTIFARLHNLHKKNANIGA